MFMKPRVSVGAALCVAVGMLPLYAAAKLEACVPQSDYVIWQVSLPAQTQLSAEQQSEIRLRLVGRCFDQSRISEMADRVRDAFQNFGYFHAQVAPPTLQVLDPRRHPVPVSLTFHVDEGRRFKVRSITWDGVHAFPAEQVWAFQPFRPDDVFDTSKVRDLLDAMKRLYESSGYSHFAITPEVQTTGGTVELTFRVDEGSTVSK